MFEESKQYLGLQTVRIGRIIFNAWSCICLLQAQSWWRPGEILPEVKEGEGALSFWNVVLVSNNTELIGTEKHSIIGLHKIEGILPMSVCSSMPGLECQLLTQRQDLLFPFIRILYIISLSPKIFFPIRPHSQEEP